MTTPEQQRELYEFMFPELGKEWHIGWCYECGGPPMPLACNSEGGVVRELPLLYNPDGTPDMNTFMFNARLRLVADCDVEFKHGNWYVNPWKRPRRDIAHWGRVDPWAATAEYLEAR